MGTVVKSVVSKMRVVFRPEKVNEYRTKGIPIEEDHSITLSGVFLLMDGDPCFKLEASVPVEIFGVHSCAYVPLPWRPADILSVAFAFKKDEYYWKAEWDEEELAKARNH